MGQKSKTSRMMTSQEIRSSFLEFFRTRGHTVVPSAPVVPYDDPSLLFTNAGMNQFKDVFLGSGTRPYRRAVDTQKCIRVSGKHNDLEEVGRDTYHHTFFEMLGNWSFGDYYKKEAIEWSWELLTNVWGLPKERLWATVYRDDNEAELLWKKVTDIDPSHVLRFDEKDNFWEMGETGPCGPCSEIHMDRTAGGTATASMINAGNPEVIEIWNLVFIQYDRDAAGTLTPLPSQHVDTGLGFERICAVLQNKSSNYDTDVFAPLIQRISTLSGVPYDGRMDDTIPSEQAMKDTAMRVVADHIRALTFAVGDGAIPSNEGRGYVLRRILRRAARFGHNLGMHEAFLFTLVPTIVETMSHIFPEIKAKMKHIQKTIKGEEDSFSATLERGLSLFEQLVEKVRRSGSRVISGEDTFKLYDTFGFPIDLTHLMAKERGIDVDEKGFSELLEEQRERSRESGKAFVPGISKFTRKPSVQESSFTGYEHLEGEAMITSVGDGFLTLDRTPFYAEAGGQVGDSGLITTDDRSIEIVDTQRDGNVIGHRYRGEIGDTFARSVTAKVDVERRLAIMRNHTATHLVHEALRRILGPHLHQSGSLVAPDHLRFDFNHSDRVSPEELQAIEDMVNAKIEEDIAVVALNDPKKWISIEEARKRWPNVKMFFGEKYGDKVRVVEIDPLFSVELCGGTHVKTTKEVGFFKFRSEGSVASGIRRIEAVTGDHAQELLRMQGKDLVDRLEYAIGQFDELQHLKTDSAGAVPIDEKVFGTVGRLLQELHASHASSKGSATLQAQFNDQDLRRRKLEEAILVLFDIRKQIEKARSRERVQSMSSDIDTLIQTASQINGLRLVATQVTVESTEELKTLGDTLRNRIGSGVGLLATVLDNKVVLVCVVTDDLVSTKTLEAGKIVGAVARLLDGGGGGRAHMATAGGKNVSKLNEALQSADSIIRNFLKHKDHP